MEFRLLGDVEARAGGRLVDLGHARQQCVLVALLADANSSVSADQLLERVWADKIPLRGRETLHSYLSRLRRVLGGSADFGIVRQAGRYVIRIDPDVVDLHRFHRLVEQAGTADDATAQALLEQALGLWRGEAFAGLDTPWVNALRESVTRQRHSAQLDLNDLRLRAGRPGELVAELATQTQRHPLDERLAGQFMLALFRGGQRADALACYRRIRTLLAEELGIDPGPPLRELHQAILTAGTEVGPPAVRPQPVLVVPRQLPAPPAGFIARNSELAELTKIAGQPELPLRVLADELTESSARLDAMDTGELAANLRAVFHRLVRGARRCGGRVVRVARGRARAGYRARGDGRARRGTATPPPSRRQTIRKQETIDREQADRGTAETRKRRDNARDALIADKKTVSKKPVASKPKTKAQTTRNVTKKSSPPKPTHQRRLIKDRAA